MFVQNLRRRVAGRLSGESEAGFTLVELLVVMLILGLLAAIAIPSFFNQRDKARDSDAKAAVRTAQTAMETYATDNDGEYDSGTVTQTTLEGIEPTLADATLAISTPSGSGPPADTALNSYTVTATSGTTNTFSITRHGDGTTEYTCAPAATDGCPTGGTWD